MGDLVVLVVADTRYLAEDAWSSIEVEYEDLPPVTTAEEALDPSSPPIFEDLGSERVGHTRRRTPRGRRGAFAKADGSCT